ncbi:MAG: hypothetical protein ACREGJ_01120 [Candidatus Saccharimonadales bacterium]
MAKSTGQGKPDKRVATQEAQAATRARDLMQGQKPSTETNQNNNTN